MRSFAQGLRTLLILGRISNLPTVWSNLLAGSIFAGLENHIPSLFLVLIGGSFLYIGGMYLNDYCDAVFDAQHYPQRPISSGTILRRTVGQLAALWFLLGFACLVPLGWITAGIALLLVAAIVLYDFHHKGVSWAPLVMGACRFLLYPLAASAAVKQILFWYIVPAGAGLGLYVAGISYLARAESQPVKQARWPLLLLTAPIFLALGLPPPHFLFTQQLYFSLLLIGWMAWLLIPLWRKTHPSIGRVVSGLLAGIVLVDIIAVIPFLELQAAWFLLLFVLALLLQRVIPAT